MKKDTIVKFYSDFKIYIFPAVVSLSSLFLIVFAIYPQTMRLINNQKTADELLNKSKVLETKVAALENYNEEELSQKVGFALTSFPADKDFGEVFQILQQIITKSGFRATSITLGNAGGKLGSLDSFEIKLEAQGSKALFPILLTNLESANRLIRVNSIDTSTNQNSQMLSASLSVGVLYAPLPKSFGTTDSPLPKITEKDEELLTKLAKVEFSAPAVTPSSSRGKLNPFE